MTRVMALALLASVSLALLGLVVACRPFTAGVTLTFRHGLAQKRSPRFPPRVGS